jgi:exonuclease III
MKSLALGVFLLVSTATAAPLTVSSFNLQWYGLGGTMRGHPKGYNEYRNYHLKRFMEKHLFHSDVLLFQEVVTVDALQLSVVTPDYQCVTYPGPRPHKHQYIVACVKRALKFDLQVIDEMQMGNGNRPGLAVVIHGDKGTPKLRIVGVHLKAGLDIEDTEERAHQVGALTEWLKKQEKTVPTIVTGDFNEREPEALRSLFEQADLEEAVLGNPTFISEMNRKVHNYDRFYVQKSLLTKTIKKTVFEACQKLDHPTDRLNDYMDWTFYVRFISDHCPISLELDI